MVLFYSNTGAQVKNLCIFRLSENNAFIIKLNIWRFAIMIVGTSNARKQRNAVVITIPARFNIEVGQKFYIIKEEDTIRLVPETEDFFMKIDELDLQQELEEYAKKYVP